MGMAKGLVLYPLCLIGKLNPLRLVIIVSIWAFGGFRPLRSWREEFGRTPRGAWQLIAAYSWVSVPVSGGLVAITFARLDLLGFSMFWVYFGFVVGGCMFMILQLSCWLRSRHAQTYLFEPSSRRVDHIDILSCSFLLPEFLVGLAVAAVLARLAEAARLLPPL